MHRAEEVRRLSIDKAHQPLPRGLIFPFSAVVIGIERKERICRGSGIDIDEPAATAPDEGEPPLRCEPFGVICLAQVAEYEFP